MAFPVGQNDSDTRQRDPVSALHQQLDRLLEGWSDLPSLAGGGFTPLADVEETDDAYLVEIELPGVDKDDIEVELTGQQLAVTGERKERERAGILRRRTRTVGRFRYEVVLPGATDDEGVTASMDQGVLSVRVPKPEQDRPRRIQVRVR